MHISSFVHVQYCFNYLIDQTPIGLLLYSHIPTALLTLVFGSFVFIKKKTLASSMLFGACICFAIWCAFDLASWFAFLGSSTVMFTWSLLDLDGLLMFFFTYYFLYSFITDNPLPTWQKIISFMVILPQIAITFFGLNLTTYDANSCAAIENELITRYVYVIEALFILASLAATTIFWKKRKDRLQRKKNLLAGIGVNALLIFFFSATFLVSLLAESDASLYVYNYEIYGLFGMPIFLVFLGYLIVRYHAFDLRIFGAQALTIALLGILGSELAFTSSFVNQVLISITLLLTLVAGMILVRSVRREIEQREQIQKLAGDLADTNKRQETLIHFIGHEVKASLTKDAGALASLVEGDFGALSDGGKQFAEHALAEARTGVDAVSNILKASNLKKGTVTYVKEPFDMKAVVAAAVEKAKSAAEQKGLTLTFAADESQQYQLNGDKTQLNDHVLRNLIDNAVNYTPSGSINVSLKKENGKVIFAVKDTGVGITDEDKKLLFTEGGHGKESQKVNVHSTGYGLFIAKQITEAHGGTIRAESEGPGKGSTFIVELPTNS